MKKTVQSLSASNAVSEKTATEVRSKDTEYHRMELAEEALKERSC